jgi:hypothetical protein
MAFTVFLFVAGNPRSRGRSAVLFGGPGTLRLHHPFVILPPVVARSEANR